MAALTNAAPAVEYSCALLGTVTHAANNCPCLIADGSGGAKTVLRRDTTAQRRRHGAGSVQGRHTVNSSVTPDSSPLPLRRRRFDSKAAALVQEASADAAFMALWMSRCTLKPATGPSAMDRMAAVQARISSRARL